MKNLHKPVMIKEIIENINFKNCKFFLDGTFGGGGHSQELLSRGCNVMAIDNYSESEKIAVNNKLINNNLFFYKSNFRDIDKIISENNIIEKFDGVLLDLGFSSNQLEDDNIGLSFKKNVFLNMNYADFETSAFDILNKYSEEDLTRIFKNYGEIYNSQKLSRFIINNRNINMINTTNDFIEILKNSGVNFGSNKINFATKPFQALRIEANKELYNLEVFLNKIHNYLNFDALIFIISFHSLEDRIVKNYFKENAVKKKNNNWGYDIITKRPIIATKLEIKENPRSRSAKLRIAKFKC